MKDKFIGQVPGLPSPKDDPSSQEAIIARVRYLIKRTAGTQSRFSEKIGIDSSNLSKHLSGHLPITHTLINRIVVEMGVSKDWLWFGTGTPFSEGSSNNNGMLGVTRFDIPVGDGNRRSRVQQISERPSGVPVYDIDVTAGNYNLDQMFTVDQIIGYINLPRLSHDTLLVHVSGDSMEPEIANGGYIAIRPVENFDAILYGQIYVVVTEDFRRVKYLRRDPSNPNRVVLHSANPNYDDIDIDKTQIKKLFRVEAILNYKICG